MDSTSDPDADASPPFSPSGLTARQAHAQLIETLHRTPRHSQMPYTRWTLAVLISAVLWLTPLTPSGAHRLLKRLGIAYRRGQEHLHSPDPDYATKLEAVQQARTEARQSKDRVVLVYLDEVTYYRRPSVARCYAPAGRGPGPLAAQGHGTNTKRRVVAALDATSGRLNYWQGSRIGVAELARFYGQLRADYPKAETIYVAQDNWPVHFNPRVLGAVEGQGIKLLRLPTYAPWTNPTEKVWRKLKQEVIHQHDFAADWEGLKEVVEKWLDRARADPASLHRYTGLRRGRHLRTYPDNWLI